MRNVGSASRAARRDAIESKLFFTNIAMASDEMLDRVLDVAMRAARRAGEHMRNNLGTAGSTAKSNVRMFH